MKRHPALQNLSRDHHQALVLARGLQADTPARLRGELFPDAVAPGDTDGGLSEAVLTNVKRRFERELSPHFLLEERELLPLSLCGGGDLRRLGETLVDQHRALRAGFAQLTPDTCDPLGKLLAAHVRFEEREWFPALEAQLEPDALAELVFRLRTEPEVPIVAFEQDADGVWVARLACGHGRHVRHQPPFQEAAWVTTERGRADKLGARVACRLCRMPRMPACAESYKQSPVYDADSLPAGLLRSHRLRAGSWGRIEVHAGWVHYVLEDEGDCTLVLRPGVDGVVAPERPHHIALDPGARVQVHFCRCPG